MDVGIRVVRGKDWKWGDQDNGEGHVGTVVEIGGRGTNPKNSAVVLWDGGVKAVYRAGLQGCNDLRVFDNGPAGVCHTSVTCDECKMSGITGLRWSCVQCFNYDLCSSCYMNNKHDLNHEFLRIDTNLSLGVKVSPVRSKSKRIQAKGTFVGARVVRGAHWQYKDQDGGSGKQGVVTDVANVSNSSARSCVKIKWDATGATNNYRRGHEGKVEIKYVKDANGDYYYVDHLPLLGDYAFNIFNDGDWVKLNEANLTPGDRTKMASHLGKIGVIVSTDASQHQCVVRFDKGASFTVPLPRFLLKERKFVRGDTVRIQKQLQEVIRLQGGGHGGWTDSMASAIGKTGKVLSIDSDGDVKVLVDGNKWTFNPTCCILVAESTTAEDDDNEDDSDDRTNEAFVQLLRAMLGVQVSSTGPGPDRLVQEAAQGNATNVRDILQRHASQVDIKSSERTALQVAAHEGHTDVVTLLLNSGAKLDLKDGDGDTAYHYAVFGDKPAVLTLLLKKSVANINAVNDNGRSPLHVAVGKQLVECVKILVNNKADVNIQDNQGNTALHNAVEKDSMEIVDHIINSRRVDYKLKNEKGQNVLHLATVKDRKIALEKIVKAAPELINVMMSDGLTALHVAASSGQRRLVEILANTGRANLDVTSKTGLTPVMRAVLKGHASVIEFLVNKGANVCCEEENGDTALHIILIHIISMPSNILSGPPLTPTDLGNASAINRILQDLPVCIKTNREWLAIACFLVEKGADLEHNNHLGKSPMENVSDPNVAHELTKRKKIQGRPIPAPKPIAKPAVPKSDTGKASSGKCLMCKEADTAYTFYPCGHSVACTNCARGLKNCLSCQKTIQEKVAKTESLVRQNSAVRVDPSSITPPVIFDNQNLTTPLPKQVTPPPKSTPQPKPSGSGDVLSVNCSFCNIRARNVMFMPCMHACCSICADPIMQCGTCSADIMQKMTLFKLVD